MVTQFTSPSSGIMDITLGPDGNMWFTEASAGKIGRITPDGTISEFFVGGWPYGIVAGPDGNLWFTQPSSFNAKGWIGRISTTGVFNGFFWLPAGHADRIIRGPDGALWFTAPDIGSVGRITTSGDIATFNAGGPSGNTYLSDIVAGPDGYL